MEVRHGVWTAIGAALVAVGAPLLAYLLITAATAPSLHLAEQAWFLPLIGLLVLLTGLGLYTLAAVIVGLPLPPMRAKLAPTFLPPMVSTGIGVISGGTNTVIFGGAPTQSAASTPTPVPSGPVPDWMNADHITDRSFRLVDIPRDPQYGRFLRNKTFERCTIFGPAVVAGVDSFPGDAINEMSNCIVDGQGFRIFIPWEPGMKFRTGMIGTSGCKFLSCYLMGISLTASAEQIREVAPHELEVPPQKGQK